MNNKNFDTDDTNSAVPIGVLNGRPIFNLPHDDMFFSLGVNDGKAPYLFAEDEPFESIDHEDHSKH